MKTLDVAEIVYCNSIKPEEAIIELGLRVALGNKHKKHLYGFKKTYFTIGSLLNRRRNKKKRKFPYVYLQFPVIVVRGIIARQILFIWCHHNAINFTPNSFHRSWMPPLRPISDCLCQPDTHSHKLSYGQSV